MSAMDIGIPREIKNHEYRAGATPSGVRALVANGHRVVVESEAGARIGFSDAAYRAAGATVLSLAGKGLRRAIAEDPGLRAGLQIHAGRITHAGLAQDTGRDCTDPLEALAGTP